MFIRFLQFFYQSCFPFLLFLAARFITTTRDGAKKFKENKLERVIVCTHIALCFVLVLRTIR